MNICKAVFFLSPNNTEQIHYNIAESVVLLYFQFYIVIQIAEIVSEET